MEGRYIKVSFIINIIIIIIVVHVTSHVDIVTSEECHAKVFLINRSSTSTMSGTAGIL